MEYIHSFRWNRIHQWCWMMLFFISQNFGKLVKNLKEYKTKIYFTIKVSVIKIDSDFNHRNFDRVSETIKFRRYLYFRQTVRSVKCPFGKMSVRQNVRSAKRPSAKCPFGKTSVGKMSVRQNVFRQSVFRQTVRPPQKTHIAECHQPQGQYKANRELGRGQNLVELHIWDCGWKNKCHCYWQTNYEMTSTI